MVLRPKQKAKPRPPEEPKKFAPPKMHKVIGDPRRTWPGLEDLIARQEAHYDQKQPADSPEDPPSLEQIWDQINAMRPFYRADAMVVPIDPKVAARAFPEIDPPLVPKVNGPAEDRPARKRPPYIPPRDNNTRYDERQRRRRAQPLGEPFTCEAARLYAWAYYHLKQLDRQLQQKIATRQAEINRLQAKLNGSQEEPASAKPASAKQTGEKPTDKLQTNQEPKMNPSRVMQETSVIDQVPEGPVVRITNRHAHADEGMAPKTATVEPTLEPSEAVQRGPP